MRRRTRTLHTGALAAIALLAVATGACGVFAEQPVVASPTPLVQPNVLVNPGFEAGADPWFAPSPDWQPFSVDNLRPRTGTLSLDLQIAADGRTAPSAVSGAAQRIQEDVFPEFLSGYYFVDAWQPGEAVPYLSVTLSIVGGDDPDGAAIHELRLMLAGARQALRPLESGAYVFLSRDEPAIGEWVYFAYPVLEAVRSALGWDPLGWQYVDVAFELRYDRERPAASGAARVYYDDLYLGPQALSPNPPDGD